MKKILTGLMVCLLILSSSSAIAVTRRAKAKQQVKVNKLKKQVVRKKRKLKKAVLKNKKIQVVPVGKRRIKPLSPKNMTKPKRPRSFTEVELGVGYIAGIPALEGALRLNNPMGMISSSVKLGVAYAVGEDSDSVQRKHALVFIDGIYHMAPMFTPGVKPYVGGGLNLDAYTTGRKNGALAAHAYLGLQGKISHNNSAYFEVGYGYIRTGFSPEYKGIHSVIGVKTIL